MTADMPSLPTHFDPEAIEPKLVERWAETGRGPRRCPVEQAEVLLRHAAAQRHGPAPHRPRPRHDVAGRGGAPQAPARLRRAVAARHRSRQHRHPFRRRAGTRQDRRDAVHPRPRDLPPPRRGLARPDGRRHPGAAPPPRLHAGLVARALHARSRHQPGRRARLRVDAPRGADPPRHAAGQLGPEVPHRRLGPRGRDARRGRSPLAHPLPAGGRPIASSRRGDDAARDAVRRPGGRGEPVGRALSRHPGEAGHPAAHGPHDPGHRRRARRSRAGHRCRQDHAGARFQTITRSASGTASSRWTS